MPATHSIDTTIFDKKPKFLGIFLVSSFIGIMLISFAVYHASKELEVIHEVDNMNRLLSSLLGQEKIEQILRSDADQGQYNIPVSNDTAYHFFVIPDNHIQSIQHGIDADMQILDSVDLESTRINDRGGYFENDENIFTWVTFHVSDSNKRLLVVHAFRSEGNGVLVGVYIKRIIIPAFFYMWMMVWVALIFNHLLHKLRNQQDKMKQMALYDSLTSLPNRNLMEDRLLKLIQDSHRNNKKFSFSLIDLDGFKAINDKYGHLYGDELLRQVAKRLESILRESDTAARLGGDEFIVMLSDIDEHVWHSAFMRVLTVLIEPYTLFDTTITVSASIGVSIYPMHGDNSDALLSHADHAMYAAKAEGGGIQMFEQGAQCDNVVAN